MLTDFGDHGRPQQKLFYECNIGSEWHFTWLQNMSHLKIYDSSVYSGQVRSVSLCLAHSQSTFHSL